MKKTLLVMIILAVTLGRAFSQSPTLSFAGPTDWTPGTSITLSVDLTYTGFNAVGLSYWLEINNALAPFLTSLPISPTSPFPIGNTVDRYPIVFVPGGNGFRGRERRFGGGGH